MCRLFRLLAIIAILTGPWPTQPRSASGTEIDRLLAAVNGKVITDLDLRLARVYNALLRFGRSGAELSREDELDRLIDIELMRQELESFPLAPSDESETEERMKELRQGYAEIGGLTVLLQRLGLQQDELESYLRLQAMTLRFLDLRFRPFVTVSPEEVQSYYTERLVPQLKRAGAGVPPLEEIEEQIGEIIIEEKVNLSMDEWIRNVRRYSRIELFLAQDSLGRENRR
jgi:hypothetical protein